MQRVQFSVSGFGDLSFSGSGFWDLNFLGLGFIVFFLGLGFWPLSFTGLGILLQSFLGWWDETPPIPPSLVLLLVSVLVG